MDHAEKVEEFRNFVVQLSWLPVSHHLRDFPEDSQLINLIQALEALITSFAFISAESMKDAMKT